MSETPEVQKIVGDQNLSTYDKVLALARLGKNAREIRRLTNCSKSYAYKGWSQVESEKTKALAPQPSEVRITEAPKKEPIEELRDIEEAEEIKGEEGAKPTPSLITPLLKGEFSAEDMQYLFESINELIPDKYQRPEKSMKLLGKVWVRPTNRYLAEYIESNADIYLALVVTLITFAPSIKGLVQEARGKQKPKPQEKGENKP